MVSTQNVSLFVPPAASLVTAQLGSNALAMANAMASPSCASSASLLASPTTTTTTTTNVNLASVATTISPLADVRYNGVNPKSVAELVALGQKRRDGHNNELTLCMKDAQYYRTLLEARRKLRAALQTKVAEYETMRAKKPKALQKRRPMAARRATGISSTGAKDAKASAEHISGTETKAMVQPKQVWHCIDVDAGVGINNIDGASPPVICSSPLSTDVEHESCDKVSDTPSGMATMPRA